MATERWFSLGGLRRRVDAAVRLPSRRQRRQGIQAKATARATRAGDSDVGITVSNLAKRFDDFQAVDGVSFEVPAGQLVALLGPSGSGKSTILRIIAGLEPADSGSVALTGEDATHLPVQRRGVGFVFQHYALFRHMTVRQNVAFGLEVQKPRPPKAEIRARVEELLDLVQLRGMAERYPAQLSGGQRQRVALARALAPRPRVLLLDEPFGALDSQVRDELRTWLRRLHDEDPTLTTLFVTHDQQEAFEVADQVVVLNKGRVEQMGPPQLLYEHPATPFVTEFLGSVNVLGVETILGMDSGEERPLPLDLPGREGPVAVYVRPHDLDVARQRNGKPGWPARIRRLIPLGGLTRLELTLHDGTSINVQLTRERCLELELASGEDVFVTPKDLKFFHEARSFVQDYVI